MNIIKPGQNNFQVIDEKTGMLRYTQCAVGKIVGTPSIQGNIASVQVQDGQTIRTKVYDLRTGMHKYTI